MGIVHDMVAQLQRVVLTQGIPGTFCRAKDPATSVPLRFLMSHPGVRQEAIVNAYGVNAQIITLMHSADFEATPPEKFDFVIQDADSAKTMPYVFDAVVRREVAGVVVAWTAYVKGKRGLAMSSLYVRDLMAEWLTTTPGLVLPYVDTINREVSPQQGVPWATLAFVSAVTQAITYCGHMEERGTFDYIALGQAGIGGRDLIAAAEHDMALVMQQADPQGRLTLLHHTPPEDFLQAGSVPWYTVSMIVDYLYEQPTPDP